MPGSAAWWWRHQMKILTTPSNVWGLLQLPDHLRLVARRQPGLQRRARRPGFSETRSRTLLGVTAAIPEQARQRLELLLTGQVSNVGAMPIIQPFNHHPGQEKAPAPEEFRSDDCLWFFNAVPAYVNETGDVDFYHKVLPYADQGEATVFGHLRRALEFNLERRGKHGLPCGLAADWNDCLKLGYLRRKPVRAFQVRMVLTVYARDRRTLGQPNEAAWALAQSEKLETSIQACAWDGEWFIWAITEDGTVYGTHEYGRGPGLLNTNSGQSSAERPLLKRRFVACRLSMTGWPRPYG